MAKQRILLTLLVASLLLAGCSFNFVYRQLDWLVPWYVSDYVSLSDSQRSELEQRVLQQLDWHCRTQLDRYAEWFRALHADPEPFTREKLERHYRTTQQFWQTLMRRVAKDSAQVLATASDAQIEELQQSLEERNRELEEEYAELSDDERLQRRKERLVKLLERWLGELSQAQLRSVAEWSEALGEVDIAPWMENRRQWQQRLRRSISRRDDLNRMGERLQQLLVEPERFWSDAYRREYQRRKALTLDMLAAVAAAMTPVQQSHLKHELLAWAKDFEALSCSDDPVSLAQDKAD